MSDREFPGSPADTPIDELREIVKRGVNIHIPSSGAAVAKRELDDRIQQEMLAGNKRIEETIKSIDRRDEPRNRWSFYLLIVTTILSAVAVIMAIVK